MAAPQAGHCTWVQGTPRWCGTLLPQAGHTHLPPAPSPKPPPRPPCPGQPPRPRPVLGPAPAGPVPSPLGILFSPSVTAALLVSRSAAGIAAAGAPAGGRPSLVITRFFPFRVPAAVCGCHPAKLQNAPLGLSVSPALARALARQREAWRLAFPSLAIQTVLWQRTYSAIRVRRPGLRPRSHARGRSPCRDPSRGSYIQA